LEKSAEYRQALEQNFVLRVLMVAVHSRRAQVDGSLSDIDK
jgi:hypothetical protein